MHIKEIKIKNFKSFKKLSFDTNRKFNVIIGENNIGKSTVFEAILLWKNCYDRIVNSKKTGFYKIDGVSNYIPFGELSFLRLINDTDLFFEAPNKCEICLIISHNNIDYSLAFEISKPKVINNSYYRFLTKNYNQFQNFASLLHSLRIKLNEALFIYQTKPISNILSKEPFMNSGQVLKKISIGKSHEVLRNKIVLKKGAEKEQFEERISKVLCTDYKFLFKNENRNSIDEFIDLKVQVNGKELDIHLQGSGFLQVAEIFSTISYLENSMSILLIDEPDSHIHVKLQKLLLKEIHEFNNTQTFIISHNDSFVSELETGELFYLNEKCKREGKINEVALDNFDTIKKELGGIIVSLDKLNSADNLIFVEGDDDIFYIEFLLKKYLTIYPEKKARREVVFYYLRGKDYVLRKIEFNKRLLSQLFKDKSYSVIFDKDYSTFNSSSSFESQLATKLGTGGRVFKHKGYCIESSLFSDKDKLVYFLCKYYSCITPIKIQLYVDQYFSNLIADFSNHMSDKYKLFEKKFNSQKKESRPELDGVTYNDFLGDCLTTGNEKLENLFNKTLISDFVKSFETTFEISILYNSEQEESDEFYSSCLFKEYIDSISRESDIVENNIDLLRFVYDIEVSP